MWRKDSDGIGEQSICITILIQMGINSKQLHLKTEMLLSVSLLHSKQRDCQGSDLMVYIKW